MSDGANRATQGVHRATQAWMRMETQFAATRAGESTTSMVAAAPEGVRVRAASVLPQVETDAAGEVRLVHAPKDRFRAQGVLGEGGMGVVERADDIDIGRPVAIKRLLPEASHALGVARFVSEVRIVGSLEHPNVAPIHDVGVDEQGRYFFVMKYVEGETLADVIERLAAGDAATHATWTFERRVEVIIGVLRALEYAHARGIVHRDIKPDNIMIGRYGEVWLMDWGIAQRCGERDPGVPAGEPAVGLIGTPAYMSPEQVRCETLDARSDLYAICVTLHELIGLKHYLAHRTESLPELLEAVERESPPVYGLDLYHDANQGPPPVELQRFCERGLQKDPALRHQSAAEMIAFLRGFIEGRGQVRCVFTLAKRSMAESRRFVDRRPKLAVGAFFTVLGLALTGAVSLVMMLL